MADMTTTIGLSDREFKRGIRDVRREVRDTGSTIGRVTSETAKTFITTEAINRSVRLGAELVQGYREQYDFLADVVGRTDTRVNQLALGIGRDLTLAMETSAGAGMGLIDVLESVRSFSTNVVAGALTLNPSQGFDVDEAIEGMERLERERRRHEEGRSFHSRYDERIAGLEGRSVDAELERYRRERDEAQRAINEAEKRERANDPDVNYNDRRRRVDELYDAQVSAVETRRAREAAGIEDRLTRMRANNMAARGDTEGALRLREELEIMELYNSINRNDLLTEEQKNKFIAEGTRLIREQYRIRREGEAGTVDPGFGEVAGQVFGRGRTLDDIEDPAARRQARRMQREAERAEEQRRREENMDPVARAIRDRARATNQQRRSQREMTVRHDAHTGAAASAGTATAVEMRSQDLSEIRQQMGAVIERLERITG